MSYLNILSKQFEECYRNGKDEWSKDTSLSSEAKKARLNFENKKIRVLDIGCGNGRLYREVFNNDNYMGCDLYKNDLWRDDKRFIQGDFVNLNFDCSFDLILDHGCFHHQQKEDLIRYLRKALLLLAPKGLLNIVTWAEPFKRFDFEDKRFHHYFSGADDLNLLLPESYNVYESYFLKATNGTNQISFWIKKI